MGSNALRLRVSWIVRGRVYVHRARTQTGGLYQTAGLIQVSRGRIWGLLGSLLGAILRMWYIYVIRCFSCMHAVPRRATLHACL